MSNLPRSWSSFLQGLAKTKEKISSGRETLHCVLGNEAADLDSMVSALVYSFYRSGPEETDLRIPVINIPRGDYKLRTEAVFLLRQAGIDPALLSFIDEIDLAGLHRAGRLELTLVDHNRLAGNQSDLADAVREIVDHHADEGLFSDALVRLIEPTGSAATLVAREISRNTPELLEKDVASLLVGTILLDTVNLDPAAQRTTPDDQAMVDLLLPRAEQSQDDLFQVLQREKFNVSDLETRDLLRKDYKEWQIGENRIGISSVLLPVKDWVARDSELAQGLEAYRDARGLDMLLAMIAYTAPGFTRELVLLVPEKERLQQLEALLNEKGLDLADITPPSLQEVASDLGLRCFSQGNLGISRKKLQPLLQERFG
ncbi:exopolyphosphatase [Alkalispirochaeta americana]|uniref:Exopolyphosphatase n=1 Tax=Alkalispirochaeta americana TaxID=159291 RepID=A0A1N6UBE6_9SPIO|nr:DHH family phosphoesterase [Alkalispirochaeta americana]SIQ62924.1 exopolyphosphatase [Alkalispirochaeta americana]